MFFSLLSRQPSGVGAGSVFRVTHLPPFGCMVRALREGSSGDRASRHMEQVLRHIRQSTQRFFPKSYTFEVSNPDGSKTTEEREFSGPLVEALEQHMDRANLRRGDSLDSVRSTRSKVFWVF